MNSTEKKGISSKVKAIIIVLALAILGLAILAFSLYSEKKRNTEQLMEQKEQLMSELKTMQSDYDTAVEKQEGTNKELLEARDIITKYIDSLKGAKADISLLWKYKNQVQVLK